MLKYLQYLIKDCYEKDFNPFIDRKYTENYFIRLSFKEWYFIYRDKRLYHFYVLNKKRYYHTPSKLLIGDDVYNAPLYITKT